MLGWANGRRLSNGRFWPKEAENKLAAFLAGELEDLSQLALPYLGVLPSRSIEQPQGFNALRYSWNRCWSSGLKPMNSMPMPRPGSLVRTKERVVTCSDSIDKSTLRLVPMERGKIVST